MNYEIWLKNREEFNFERICREVKENNPDSAGFILRLKNMQNMFSVVLYEDWLKNFELSDNILVAGERLYTGWGFVGYRVDLDRNHHFWTKYSSKFYSKFPWENIHLKIVQGAVTQVVAEIEAAKRYIRDIHILVIPL